MSFGPSLKGCALALLLLVGCGECPPGSPPENMKPTVMTDRDGADYYVEYLPKRCAAIIRRVTR